MAKLNPFLSTLKGNLPLLFGGLFVLILVALARY